MTDNYQRPAPAVNRCTSRRLRRFRIVRCSRDATHATRTKWHCDESNTGYAWLVTARDRKVTR